MTDRDESSPGSSGRIERVVLVGFMAAGKSAVGARLAAALAWRLIETDAEIERAAGLSTADIFAESGEAGFRALEERVAADALTEDDVVISTGGGWAPHFGPLDELPAGTASVWLKVSAEEALRRATADGPTRPLLDVPDPITAARELLHKRSDAYASARWAVDTEGRTVEDVSAQILEILRSEDPEVGADHRIE